MDRSRQHFQFLDYLRGIAILIVFLYHCTWAIGMGHLKWNGLFPSFDTSTTFLALLPFSFGFAGVPIFFVISGFCIHLSHSRSSDKSWKGFSIRRFFRIYPAYFLALLLFAIVLPNTRELNWLGLNFISHLFLFHNFDYETQSSINWSFWSIAVEAQLYLLYPILLLLTKRLGWKSTLILLAVLEVSLRLGVGLYGSITGNHPPQWLIGAPIYFWYSWAIGAALAEAQLHGQPLPFRNTPCALWLVLAVASDFFRPTSQFPFLFFALFTATLIAKMMERTEQPEFTSPLQTHLRSLGTWSYSFYLLHQPLLHLLPYTLHNWLKSDNPSNAAVANFVIFHPIIFFPLCLCAYPFILGISALFYKYVEVPSMALGKRFLTKKPTPI